MAIAMQHLDSKCFSAHSAGSASDDFFSVLAQKAPKESAGAEHWQAWGSGSGGTSSLGSTLIEPQAFFERVPADLCRILLSLRISAALRETTLLFFLEIRAKRGAQGRALGPVLCFDSREKKLAIRRCSWP